MSDRRPDQLIDKDWSDGVELPQSGDVRRAISNAMVGMKKQFFGRGPSHARTYLVDEFVFVVMEGGLTQHEETLLEAGEEAIVRGARLRWQEVMEDIATGAIEKLTGREVIAYQSQVTFDPMFTIEFFALGPRLETNAPATS